MARAEIDPGLRSLIQTIDYNVITYLQVPESFEEQTRCQQGVIRLARQIVNSEPRLTHRFPNLDKLLEDPEFNNFWNDKRHLGHIQRCIASGDSAFEEFGLFVLESLQRRDTSNNANRVLFMGVGEDTRLAWTISPFLLRAGKSFDKIMNWVGTGEIQGEWINLRGLNELPLRQGFVLRDRFDISLKDINPRIPPLNQHRNYPVAQAIAQYLITSGVV